MKKIIVVTPKTFFPLTATISSFLLMKHLNASDFAMGVFWSLIVILWIIALIIIIKQETVRLEDFVEEEIKRKIKPTIDEVKTQLQEIQKLLKNEYERKKSEKPL